MGGTLRVTYQRGGAPSTTTGVADTDTLNDIIGDINACGLERRGHGDDRHLGGTNKLRIDADSADIDFEIAAFSGCADRTSGSPKAARICRPTS